MTEAMQNIVTTKARRDVFEVIHEERVYQDQRWSGQATPSISAFILFMEHHLELARQVASTRREDWEDHIRPALHQLRKVAALAVACMEHHGTPSRSEEMSG